MRLPIYRHLDHRFEVFGLSPLELIFLMTVFAISNPIMGHKRYGTAAVFVICFLLAFALRYLHRKFDAAYLQKLGRYIGLPSALPSEVNGTTPAEHFAALKESRSCSVENILEFGKDGIGFCLQIEGIDASLYDLTDLSRLQESWRELAYLDPGEEVHFVFSRRSDFESFIEKKLEETELLKNEFTKKLFFKNLNALVKDLDLESPRLFTSRLVMTYQKKFSEKAISQESRVSFIQQKLEDYRHAFVSRGMSVEVLSGKALVSTQAAFASGLSYVESNDLVDVWPNFSISPRELLINDHLFRGFVLKTLPETYSEMGMIQSLTRLAVPLQLSVRLRGRDGRALRKKLERKKELLVGLSSQRSSVDIKSHSQAQQLADVLKRLDDQNDALLDMTLAIGVRTSKNNESLMRSFLTEILAAQSRMGHLEFKETTLSSLDCLLELLPGFSGKNLPMLPILASNATHFLPLFEPARGHRRPVATFRSRDGELFSVDPTDSQLANFNWLVTGTSGSGKSFFVNSLLLQSMSIDPRIFIVDIGGSYHKLTRFLGGDSIGLDVQHGFKIGPFFMEKSDDPTEERRRQEHIQMVFWEMLRDENKLPSIEERGLLKEALDSFFVRSSLPKHPVSELREILKSYGERARRLVLLLDRWCYPSFFGDFLDHGLALNTSSSIINFDLKGLQEFGDLSRVVQLIICSSLWSQIRRHPERFTFIVLDEVAFSLLKYQPSFVDELVSTVRKHNAGCILVAQDLEKITSNTAGASILQNTQMKAILQQRGNPSNYAGPLQLRELELQVIQSLDRQKGFFSDIFLMIDNDRVVIRHRPTREEYLLATSTPLENRELDKELQNASGDYADKFLQLTAEVSS